MEDADSDRMASWEKNYLAPSGRDSLTHAMCGNHVHACRHGQRFDNYKKSPGGPVAISDVSPRSGTGNCTASLSSAMRAVSCCSYRCTFMLLCGAEYAYADVRGYLSAGGAQRTKAGHTNVVLIVIAVLCGIAFAGAAVYAVYQHRVLRAIKSDSLNNGYISLNAVGRDNA